jgi:hypothetical protein
MCACKMTRSPCLGVCGNAFASLSAVNYLCGVAHLKLQPQHVPPSLKNTAKLICTVLHSYKVTWCFLTPSCITPQQTGSAAIHKWLIISQHLPNYAVRMFYKAEWEENTLPAESRTTSIHPCVWQPNEGTLLLHIQCGSASHTPCESVPPSSLTRASVCCRYSC